MSLRDLNSFAAISVQQMFKVTFSKKLGMLKLSPDEEISEPKITLLEK